MPPGPFGYDDQSNFYDTLLGTLGVPPGLVDRHRVFYRTPTGVFSVTKPIDYMLKRWDGFARFAEDGRICLTNNAAERALRGFALGRRSWLFAGSDRGADRAAAITTLIMTAKLNDLDPLAWLADVLARIASLPQSLLYELLPWNWEPKHQISEAA